MSNDEVIRVRSNPASGEGGVAVLRGNLAPHGAVIKQTAATPSLLVHTGPAVVFRDYNDLSARIDDPDLPVTADSVLVLQHAGPLGGPGMPEWGMLPIPKKLLQAGVRDMVPDLGCADERHRLRHVRAPRGARVVCGRAAGLRARRRPDRAQRPRAAAHTEGQRGRAWPQRRTGWVAPAVQYPRGYGKLHAQHVLQADQGCDFDFLQAGRRFRSRRFTSATTKDSGRAATAGR